MRILATNDDGIDAPGLWAMVEALSALGEVCVAAPDRDKSGIGTARTLLDVLRANEADSPVPGVRAYSVSGTPADCVILGAEALFPGGFDLVASGINAGANLGMDTLDSGTVGGALRGYFRGVPSMAVSVTAVSNVRYDAAARAALNLARAISEDGAAAKPLLYNINVPNAAPENLRGAKMTFLGPKAWLENVVKGSDGHRTHYWIRHNKPTSAKAPEGSDLWATRAGWISVTPMDPGFVGKTTDGLERYANLGERVANGLGDGA